MQANEGLSKQPSGAGDSSHTLEAGKLSTKTADVAGHAIAGVDKERFLEFVSHNPRTYADWSGSDGEWKQATTGKEEALPSPFLAQEFRVAAQKGAISEAEFKMVVKKLIERTDEDARTVSRRF